MKLVKAAGIQGVRAGRGAGSSLLIISLLSKTNLPEGFE